MNCCICRKVIKDWGNNPYGALDENGEQLEWKDDDECCDDCNKKYVIKGRIASLLMNKDEIVRILPNILLNRT